MAFPTYIMGYQHGCASIQAIPVYQASRPYSYPCHRMNLLSTLILLASVVLTLGCAPAPGAPNIARNGEASQVSTYDHVIMGYAKLAIDGISYTDFTLGTCTHADYAKDPWWKLDLKQSYRISNVVITNRMDCCSQRLIGAEVRIGNSPDNNNPVCGTVGSVESSTLSYCCNGMEGQYVSVVIPGRSEYLSLCEVKVYGDVILKES